MRKIFINLLLLVSISATACMAQSKEERSLGNFTKVKSSGSFDVVLKKGNDEKAVITADSGPIEKIITEVDGSTLKIYIDDDKWINNYKFRGVKIYITFTQLEEITGAGSGNLTLESPIKAQQVRISSSGSGNVVCTESIRSDSYIKIANSGSGNCKIMASVVASDDIAIQNSGSGEVKIYQLEADDLDINNSGSGNLYIDGGDVNHQSIGLSGSGNINSENLASNTCDIRKSGSGTVRINVSDELNGNSSGSGNIYLKGRTARLNIHTSGSSNIKHIN